MKVAFVIQRYGKDVVGGSELECRQVAEQLVRKGYDCTVYTTTAKDYVTWRNEYHPGETILNGVAIKRFPVKEERDIEAFNSFSDWIFSQRHSREDELEWMRQQGPESPALIEALEREQQKHDIFIFFTYLYYTTYWGLKTVRRATALVPTAHDEPPLHLEIMKDVFAAPEALVYNSEPEKDIVCRFFSVGKKYQATIGIGIEPPETIDPSPFLRKFSLTRPFLLYAGRIEKGKGCEELIRYYLRFSQKNEGLALVLIGKMLMTVPQSPRIRYLGYVSKGDKDSAMASAAVTVHPSHLESLCIAALESMAAGTPVLVQERTAPLRHHCLKGGAGLTYSNYDEFETSLHLLLSKTRLRRVLGENGRSYVRDFYSWPKIVERYEGLFEKLRGEG